MKIKEMYRELKCKITKIIGNPAIGMTIGAILTIFCMYEEVVKADMITKLILAVGVPLVIIFVFLVCHKIMSEESAE